MKRPETVADKALVLLNPTAGRGRARVPQAVVRHMARIAGIPVQEAGSPEEMEGQAREAAEAGCPRVIAAGGDGTMHRALNGLVGTGAALGILPCGTGNDLAHSLGIPNDMEAAARLAFFGSGQAVDLGRVRPIDTSPARVEAPAGRYYGCIASFGLDSHANRIANQHTGPWRGTPLYVYSMLRSLWEFRPPEVAIEHDGGCYRGRILLAVAANAPSYGGGMRIAPRAEMADGQLDLCIVRRMNRVKLLWCFPEVFSGKHLARREVSYFRSSGMRIRADRPLEIFADGEFVGYTPAEVEMLPGALRVIMPQEEEKREEGRGNRQAGGDRDEDDVDLH